MSQKSLNQADVTEFKTALKAAQLAAKKLMAVNKSELEESADKFLVIRAVRIDHTVREVLSSKSLRS